MTRARDGIEREDWKLVIDSLQRIIELPGEHVLTVDGKIYESARRQAHRKIAQLPPAGLAAYRLMYDSEAKALLARAVDEHDPALLRQIVDRYLMTQSGDDAAMTLSDWLIDESQFAEAVATLQFIKALYPDSDLPAWALSSRLSICYAALGRAQRAEAYAKELSPQPPVGVDPAAWSARLGALAEFLKRPVRDQGTADMGNWALAYGRPSRDGIMPLVEPTFADHLPWVVPVNASSRDELTGLEDEAREHGLLPTATMVMDDRLLVVKAGPVLQALDVETFDVVWRRGPGSNSRDPAMVDEPSGDGSVGAGDNNDRIENNPAARRMLRDSVGSGVTLANGLALTVEWAGEPPRADRRYAVGFQAPQTTFPNRIVAYSLKDGRQVWESSAPAGENRLGVVEFLCAPVPVNGLLLAPCRVNTDLYAVLLDPTNGRMVRHVYLCGTGGGYFDSLGALQPCVADGVVYLPTGRGAIIALESSTCSIRWVVRYESASAYAIEERWLPTPVIAVADSVLVAPQDADALFCMDRATGEIRWRAERGNHLYVLGADDRSVWLGGSQVEQLNVETGESRWKRAAGDPTGRGAISGSLIYMPTIQGLKAFKTEDGEPVELRRPVGGPLVLGNLLACNATLYSTDLFETREFPDLDRGYAEALARRAVNPREPTNAIRLARLELLRHAPAKALEALTDLPADLDQTSRRRFEQAAHLRVVSMLELAGSGEVSSQRARELLEQARAVSVSAQDAIDSALALADYHQRESRPLEACAQYLSLVLSREGDQMISEGEDFEQRARAVAVRRLADVVKSLEQVQKTRFEQTVATALAEAAAKRDATTVTWLAESGGLGATACQADIILGKWAGQDLRFEQAESCFRRALTHAAPPPLAAEAIARLAALYLLPDELHLPVWALDLIERLEKDYGTVDLPVDVLVAEGMASAPSTQAGETKSLPAARIAELLRQRVDTVLLAQHRAALGPMTLRGLDMARVKTRSRGMRPLIVREERMEPLVNQYLSLVDGMRIEACRTDDDTLLWPAELRLLDELAIESKLPDQSSNPGSGPFTAARGPIDGQTLIVNSGYGIHAVGLMTGRRLWSRKFDPPASPLPDRSGSDTWLWVQDGYVISVNRFGELEVAHAGAGDRLLWKRRRAGRRWYAVRTRGPYIVAADSKFEQADIFLLADGRYLGGCRFEQPQPMSISLFDGVICGAVSRNEVVAYELATPGVERWRVKTEADLFQLFKPSADLLAVAERGGRVQLVDPRTGKPVLRPVRVDACGDGVRDGSVSNNVFYVHGPRVKNANDSEPARMGLAAIRISDGRVLWQREDLSARSHLSAEVLECATNAIPVVTAIGGAENDQQQLRSINARDEILLEVTLLSKATGEPMGDPLRVPISNEAGAGRILHVQATVNDLRVVAGAALVRFPYRSGSGKETRSGDPK